MASVQQHSLSVRGRRLARELRALRDRADLTLEQAAAGMGWNRFKGARLETGKTRATPGDVGELLNLYGVDSAVRASMIQLAREAGQRGWWTSYSDVFTGSYVGLEDEASSIWTYHVQLLPGLLQSEDYARVSISAGLPDDPEAVERRLRARMARKTLLSRPGAAELITVLAESTLRQ